MSVFLTGATGYLGSYLATGLLRRHPELRLELLVRAQDQGAGRQRLWKAWQLHMPFEEFRDGLDRVSIRLGDLTKSGFGLEPAGLESLVHSMDSVIHCAASLNRKSAKACFNVNLRGTLEVITAARAAHDHHGLRRFSDVSTVAVAGKRKSEGVTEADTIQWDRSDYDPYARTKKFCEHMLHELLPDVSSTVFRPATVLGDSRFPETTQFDMVKAFVWLARSPVLPFDPSWRMDIVPADYVAKAITTIHMMERPGHDAYNLSSGTSSPTFQQITDALKAAGMGRGPRFARGLEGPASLAIRGVSHTPRHWGAARAASLLKVFLPYLTFDTVFDNQRIVTELGEAPARFESYAHGLMRFAMDTDFTYPYRPWPA